MLVGLEANITKYNMPNRKNRKKNVAQIMAKMCYSSCDSHYKMQNSSLTFHKFHLKNYRECCQEQHL